ncbi:hypothetical protein M5X17_31020 [Paenibacillus alvei]|uniref:hypothetical protein n=1 Tax=Paenibacillus alvei TaxID=44250 RepID=UPI00227FE3B3|nr:hypothetical protein [Paenibacillus alvei]MCY9738125.1 hypothetical protein [Paenibacillus alvei]
MTKSEVSEVLLHLWDSVDQASYDQMIREAFEKCPVSVQKAFIKRLITNDYWDLELDEVMLEKAKKLVGLA